MKGPARMGGGRMFRAAGRVIGPSAATAAAAAVSASGPARHAKSVGVVSVTSSSSSSSSPAFVASLSERTSFPSQTYFYEEDGWEPIGEDDMAEAGNVGLSRRLFFGPPPSSEEVGDAVSVIQQTFAPFVMAQDLENHFSPEKKVLMVDSPLVISSSESESDWVEPTLYFSRHSGTDAMAHEKVASAFRLLQTNPSIKRAVVSLSSDRAVWEAVMRNEAVQELREAFRAAESEGKDDGEQNLSAKIYKVFQSMKDKMVELVEKIAEVVGGLFWAQNKNKETDPFDDALRSSFMLSVVVFIVVIISRTLRS
ncbi:uncharacterized conserved protein (UCP012943) [Wolffia australiana]